MLSPRRCKVHASYLHDRSRVQKRSVRVPGGCVAAPLPAGAHRHPPADLPAARRAGAGVCKHRLPTGRARQQAERGWKNGPKCVAGEPGAYLGLRLGINWETRWRLLGRKGEKACGVHRSQRGWLGSGRGEQRRRSPGGGVRRARDVPEGPAVSPQKAGGPGSGQGAGKGRSAMGPCQLGGTGRACKDKGDRAGACLLRPRCWVSTADWKWESGELWW